jgi:copper chaperone CopZ
MNETKFKITNFDCAACAKLSKKALEKVDGIAEVKIDEKSGEGTFKSTGILSEDLVAAALRKVGKEILFIK